MHTPTQRCPDSSRLTTTALCLLLPPPAHGKPISGDCLSKYRRRCGEAEAPHLSMQVTWQRLGGHVAAASLLCSLAPDKCILSPSVLTASFLHPFPTHFFIHLL